MPLPIPNLDDRRFDDLVAEAITRDRGAHAGMEQHRAGRSRLAR